LSIEMKVNETYESTEQVFTDLISEFSTTLIKVVIEKDPSYVG